MPARLRTARRATAGAPSTSASHSARCRTCRLLRPGQVLGREPAVDVGALRRCGGQVALGLLEGRVAAVARRDQVEPRAADDGEVARGHHVIGVRVDGLDQRGLGAARVPVQLVDAHAQVVQDEPGGLLDRREARRDGASPEHRVVPHVLRPSFVPLSRCENAPRPECDRGAPLLPLWCGGTSPCRRYGYEKSPPVNRPESLVAPCMSCAARRCAALRIARPGGPA